MGTPTTVGVDDDLTTRDTGVAVGTTDDELARGIHVELHVIAEEFLQAGGQLFPHPWDKDIADICLDFLLHSLIIGKLIVLRADDDGVDTQRLPAFAVFHRHL